MTSPALAHHQSIPARPVPRKRRSAQTAEAPSVLLVRNLARFANDVVEGRRNVASLGSWVSQHVAADLRTQAQIRRDQRAYRSANQQRVGRSTVEIAGENEVTHPGSVRMWSSRRHVFDAVVMMHHGRRAFVIALCLVWTGQKWRATKITIL